MKNTVLHSFTAEEKRTLAGCFTGYLLAYVGRLNLAPVLDTLQTEFQVSAARIGLLQTVFAVLYATGQLVNGALTRRIDPRRHILTGLGLSSLCNLLMGLAARYEHLLILWALNGAVQSMLWTPMVSIVVRRFPGEKRNTASLILCFSFSLGHLIAWAISGIMTAYFSWRGSFLVPAGVLAADALLFSFLVRGPFPRQENADRKSPAGIPLRSLILNTGLIWVFMACVALGYTRDSIGTWAPKLLKAAAGSALFAVSASLLLPALEFAGTVLTRLMLSREKTDSRRAMRFFLLAAAVCALIPALFPSLPGIVFAVILGLTCACVYASSNLQSVFLPMEYGYTGRAPLIAGICDAMIYLGSGLSGVLAGSLLDRYTAGTFFLVLALTAFICCVLITLSGIIMARRTKQ